ncbi:AraC family transcriptional regulator [Mycetocola manganoxydans]|uniref:AraC family transcriptional regulator n=1 Tax=Mycetocola manganoxydans TaxID=699879 RepID=A0A3L7A2W4_9MICO|nr:AraC family transcriptional regulator [Mycetocola manganoxydans]RLP73941.1 AraC family transcriptional regulator [Mycetocola manganoxydans]GHD42219.1 AraC family transcriptional regulator [Mycetocola manganoxydans]
MTDPLARHIGVSERSGVLEPHNLVRFSARWISPAADLSDVVDTYWSVEWRLPAGDAIEQRIVDYPAITLSVEEGDVPAPYVVTAVRPQAWSRVITGSGSVFAIRLRPAGLAVLSGLDARALAPERELTADLDERAFELLRKVSGAGERSREADARIREHLAERPLTGMQQLANRAVDALVASPRVRTGRAVAAELGTSERTLQRALGETLGRGPNEVARRIRLQEVVRRLSTTDADIVTVAADLGYTDQAHLTTEFRSVAGVTPGRYVRELRRSQANLAGVVGDG